VAASGQSINHALDLVLNQSRVSSFGENSLFGNFVESLIHSHLVVLLLVLLLNVL